MKKIIFLIFLIFQVNVTFGAEPMSSRSTIRSYDSKDNALIGAGESAYSQGLEPWQNTTEKSEYVSSFKVPFLWVDRSVILHLAPIRGSYDIYINDKKVAQGRSSLTPSEFDISDDVIEGRNFIKIKAYEDELAKSLESFSAQDLSLSEGCYVLSQPKIRVADLDYKTSCVYNDGVLELSLKLKSELLNTKLITVYYELISPEGKIVTKGDKDVEFKLKSSQDVRFYVNVSDALQWSHLEPNLYRLVVKTQHEGRFMEYMSFDVGFRNLEFRSGDMFVNGAKVDIFSSEVSPSSCNLDSLKAEGVNFLILENHNADDDFYAMADRKGFYVLDRVGIQTTPELANNPKLEQEFTTRALNTYANSKNHVSVVAYSLAQGEGNGYNLYQSFLAMKQLKPEQAIVYMGAKGEWNTDNFDLKQGSPSPAVLAKIERVGDDKIRVTNLNEHNALRNLSLNIKGTKEFTLEKAQSKEFVTTKKKGIVLSQKISPTYYELNLNEKPQSRCPFLRLFSKKKATTQVVTRF